MSDKMTAEEYRQTIVNPALEAEGPNKFDNPIPGPSFKKKVKEGLPEVTEHQIQSLILERLSFIKNGFFWRENSGLITAEHNGKKRHWRAGIKGIADIIGVYKGFFVAIEVKRAGKKPSVEQKAYLQRVRDCGGIGFVCDDDKTVIESLETYYAALVTPSNLPID